MIQSRELMETVFNSKCTNRQLTTKGIIKWLNSKLEPLFAIKVVPIAKSQTQDPRYRIKSPWRITIGGIAKVLHYPLETEVTDEAYLTNYVELLSWRICSSKFRRMLY